MNKDHSFENIDFIKLLLWICLLAALVFGIWAGLIIPSNKIAQGAAIKLSALRSERAALAAQSDELGRQLAELERKNAPRLEALAAEFSEEGFISYCKTFFDEAALEDNLLPDVSEYTNYKLLVSAKISSPSSFYDFLGSLSGYSSIVQVDFPIIMKRSNDQIRAQFNVRVYRLKPPERS